MNNCEICSSHLLCHSAFLSERGMDPCHGFMIISTIHLFPYVMFPPTIHTFLLARVHFLSLFKKKKLYKYIYIAKCWQQNAQSLCLLRWAYPIESPMGEEHVATSIPFKISRGGSNYTNPKTHHWNIAILVSQEDASTYLPAT